MSVVLPKHAFIAINRCNLPALILGSLSFQQQPRALEIDGVKVLHKDLFHSLDRIDNTSQRAECFVDYMTVKFRLHKLEDAGLMQHDTEKRVNADYLRMLRGWFFDPNGIEAAALKGWVESRFGLLTRFHKEKLGDYSNHAYQVYLRDRSQGLYATNAIEAQLDLLYSYCQYELQKKYNEDDCLTLYRGVNSLDDYEIIERFDKKNQTLLLNNLNSFSRDRDRACEFGDYILETRVPCSKIFFYADLLSGIFRGEDEVIVIGGLYHVTIRY